MNPPTESQARTQENLMQQAAYRLGVADERTRCAGICDEIGTPFFRSDAYDIKQRILQPAAVKSEQQEQLDELDKRNLGTL